MNTEYPDLKNLLSRSLVHKYLSGRLLLFAEDQNISDLMSSMHSFNMQEAMSALESECKYVFRDNLRKRMIKVLIDFLCECGHLTEKNARYFWNGGSEQEFLSAEEAQLTKEFFKGQVEFFERCLNHAGEFLRGGGPLYSFDDGSTRVWEDFLGNEEFNFARSVLARVMLSGRNENSHILDLCHGPGFDILQIQKHFEGAKVTALDFKDVFRSRALSRIPNPKAVQWVDSKFWNGFGSPLPFDAETFDFVFFACADPYIPDSSRAFVYRDLYRILKPGGAVSILSHSYPDIERSFVSDPWMRRGILCHDFSESVCEGWRGFYGAEESVSLFESIGFKIGTVMMNASIWRLEKS